MYNIIQDQFVLFELVKKDAITVLIILNASVFM